MRSASATSVPVPALRTVTTSSGAALATELAPRIVAEGISDEAELGLDTLQERIADEVRARDAVILPPTVVGAWGTVAGALATTRPRGRGRAGVRRDRRGGGSTARVP